jgi:hypothetical protein
MKILKERTVQDVLAEVRLGIQKIQEVLDSDVSDEAKLLCIGLYFPVDCSWGSGFYTVRNFTIDNIKEQQKAVEAMEELTVKGYLGRIFTRGAVHSYTPGEQPILYLYVFGNARNINMIFEPLFPFTTIKGDGIERDKLTLEEQQYILEHPEVLRSQTVNGQPSLFSRLENYSDLGTK